MLRRAFVLVAALTLLVPTTVLAQDPDTERLLPVPVGGGDIDPQVLPAALDDARIVTVMVELAGDPVAVVESRAPNRELTKAERDAIKAQLRAQQDAITGGISAQGGVVLAQLQSAYNGIKVQIGRSQVAALASLPNVVAIRGLAEHTIGNASSVPFIGVPSVWNDLGFTGSGIKVAVIDTGIDYTHANFGGPGTPEAYDLADANDLTIGDAGDAASFGPTAPKVKGGHDFVGDAYNAASTDPARRIPHPDPDPLDCFGHGSHVAGSVAGFGVLATGTTFPGPYDATTHSNDFNAGPGVAPLADLYALRVFGCAGSTNVTVDAIDWAVDNDMDVINMSLGSSFGRAGDPSAVASTNAAAAGVIVVASAGNSGPSQYITGSPSTGTGAISVAAVDDNQTFPAEIMALSTGSSVTAISANGITLADATSLPVVVLQNNPATPENEALGCSVAAYAAAVGAVAVTERGVCARVARAIFGQQAGAAAVLMINNVAGYPPYEGPITRNPDTGEEFTVTIPFLGVQGPSSGADAVATRAANGGTATFTATTIANPGFRGFASFSSGGPRNGDSLLKPDVAAPGVSIQSTANGTGFQGTVMSGTSMAAPHVAGLAALVRQAHPDWSVEDIKAAIANSGAPTAMVGYRVTRAGSGLVTAPAAVGTSVVALGDLVAGDADTADFHNSNLSFGFAELGANFSQTRWITVRNHGSAEVTLTPSFVGSAQSSPASVSFGAGSVLVPAGGEATLSVTLAVPAATAGSSSAFREVSGNVVLAGGGLTLRVPYLLVPRALSGIETVANGAFTPNSGGGSLTVANPAGVRTGTADFYQWGLVDADDVNEAVLDGAGYDLRAVGVQSFVSPFDPSGADRLIVFGLSMHDRWSTAAVNEYDILLDTTGDGVADFAIVGFDLGALTTGTFSGVVASFRINLTTRVVTPLFLASAPTDSSTILLPVLGSQLGLTAANGGFTYTVASFSLEGPGQDAAPGAASYNAWAPTFTDFPFVAVPVGGSANVPLGMVPTSFAMQKPLGLMIVSPDNASGAAEAQLIELPGKKKGH